MGHVPRHRGPFAPPRAFVPFRFVLSQFRLQFRQLRIRQQTAGQDGWIASQSHQFQIVACSASHDVRIVQRDVPQPCHAFQAIQRLLWNIVLQRQMDPRLVDSHPGDQRLENLFVLIVGLLPADDFRLEQASSRRQIHVREILFVFGEPADQLRLRLVVWLPFVQSQQQRRVRHDGNVRLFLRSLLLLDCRRHGLLLAVIHAGSFCFIRRSWLFFCGGGGFHEQAVFRRNHLPVMVIGGSHSCGVHGMSRLQKRFQILDPLFKNGRMDPQPAMQNDPNAQKHSRQHPCLFREIFFRKFL